MKQQDEVAMWVELTVMRSLGERLINLCLASTDENLKTEVIKLISMIKSRSATSQGPVDTAVGAPGSTDSPAQ